MSRSAPLRRCLLKVLPPPVVCWLWLLSLAPFLAGCGGCGNDPLTPQQRKKASEEARRKLKEKPKPDFEIQNLVSQPYDPASSEKQNAVKAGHWVTASQEMKANNFDFQAELQTRVADSERGEQKTISGTPFRFSSTRPITLPKGQTRFPESTYYIPPMAPDDAPVSTSPQPLGSGQKKAWLRYSLRARGGREINQAPQDADLLPSHVYFFLVLAADPDRYQYVHSLRTMKDSLKSEDLSDTALYRVVIPRMGNRAPIPSQPLTWTSIAYVLWDGLDPNMLTSQQQEALLQWLHWGGQLILSGPGSLDRLKSGFLADYLPAQTIRDRSLAAEDFAGFNRRWSIRDARGNRLSVLPDPEQSILGVEWQKHASAVFLHPDDPLVLERRVGAGRIVATAFPLSDVRMLKWKGYDSFFQNGLMRRPHREYFLDRAEGGVRATWPSEGPMTAARYGAKLRYFTRDTPPLRPSRRNGRPPQPDAETSAGSALRSSLVTQLHEFPPTGATSPAAWNSDSGPSRHARESLQQAAGITVPRAELIFKILAIYVIVLAPVNWMFFRLIGRVEWAWAAAPVIALVGAGVVIRVAQLDIGFARSRTEIGVLELQGGYRRGHLTRYTALYTSLSTSYNLEFEDPSALALPFPTGGNAARQTTRNVNLNQAERVRLRDFHVRSNSTGLVHSEQTLDAGGAIRLLENDQGFQLHNDTDFPLQGSALLQCAENGQLRVAWLGRVGAHDSSREVRFSPLPDDARDLYLPQWRESPTTSTYETQRDILMKTLDNNRSNSLSKSELQQANDAEEMLKYFDWCDRDYSKTLDVAELLQLCRKARDNEFTLGRLFELVGRNASLSPGEIRLAGWTDHDPEGLKILPAASQKRVRLMVLAHLRRPSLEKIRPRPDVNLYQDLKKANDRFDINTLEGVGETPRP